MVEINYKKLQVKKYIVYFPLIVATTEVVINSFFSNSIDHYILFYVHLSITIFLTLIIGDALLSIYSFKNSSKDFKEIKKITNLTLFFIVVMLIAMRSSTDIVYSFSNIWRFSICLLALPTSLYFFQIYPGKIKKYFKYIIYSSLIYFVAIPFFSVLKIGSSLDSEYGARSLIYGGGIGFYNIYPVIYMLIFSILYLYYGNKNKITGGVFKDKLAPIIYMLGAISFVVVLLFITKRDYLIMIVLGIGIFILNYNKLSIRKYIPVLGLLTILFVLAQVSGINKAVISQFTDVRKIEDKPLIFEGRVLEYVDWYYEFKSNKDVGFILFGKEIFNSRGKFFQYSIILQDRDRVLHSEITHMLYGIGVIGLLFYFYYFYTLFFSSIAIKRKSKDSKEVQFYWALFVAFFIVNMAVNFSGGLFRLFDKLLQYQMMGVFLAMIIVLSNRFKMHKDIITKIEKE